jgi:uracil phosphoribosyltransferase
MRRIVPGVIKYRLILGFINNNSTYLQLKSSCLIMPLNIYTINHPLTRMWTSNACNVQSSENEMIKLVRKIGVVLLYEATRRSLSTHTIYVAGIEGIAEVSLFPKQSSYNIIADMYLSRILYDDIYELIPSVKIYPVYTKMDDNQSIFNQNFGSIPQSFGDGQAMIIMERHLEIDRLFAMIELLLQRGASIQQIQICCILCSTDILQTIGKRYPSLNIYTTKIIDDNSNQYASSFWDVSY